MYIIQKVKLVEIYQSVRITLYVQLQYCAKVIETYFDEFPGFSALFDEIALERKFRRHFVEFSGRLLF